MNITAHKKAMKALDQAIYLTEDDDPKLYLKLAIEMLEKQETYEKETS